MTFGEYTQNNFTLELSYNESIKSMRYNCTPSMYCLSVILLPYHMTVKCFQKSCMELILTYLIISITSRPIYTKHLLLRKVLRPTMPQIMKSCEEINVSRLPNNSFNKEWVTH